MGGKVSRGVSLSRFDTIYSKAVIYALHCRNVQLTHCISDTDESARSKPILDLSQWNNAAILNRMCIKINVMSSILQMINSPRAHDCMKC